MDGKAVVAHDALDYPFVAKKMQRSYSVKKPPACDELLPLTSGVVLFDLPCPEAIVVPEAIDEELPQLSVPDHHGHYNRADFIPWTSFSFWERSSILTCGIPNLKMNIENPLALCQVIFDNCVVKVREGIDLNNLLTLGRKGDVELTNVTSFGWVATERTLLPCCIFERWISNMGAAGIVLEGVSAGAAAAAAMIAFKPSD
jgi:hypothetical protein